MSHKKTGERYDNEHTRAAPDEFDEDLKQDNARTARGNAMSDYTTSEESGAGLSQPHAEPFTDENRQKDRSGQAESPRELKSGESGR